MSERRGAGKTHGVEREKSVYRKKKQHEKLSPKNSSLLKGKYVREISAFSFSQILLRTYIFPPGFKLWKQRSNKLFLSGMCRNTNQDTMKSKDPAPEDISLKYNSAKMRIRN